MANMKIPAHSPKTRHDEDTAKKSPRDIVSIARDFDNAMLVTHAAGGALHARPMSVAQVEESGKLWFVTSMESEKVEEIARDPRVTVLMQGKAMYLRIAGKATAHRDRQKLDELWSESMKIWFDDKNDPSIVLIELFSEEAEYWDISGTQGIKLAFRAAKAVLTGEKLSGKENPDNHGKVRL